MRGTTAEVGGGSKGYPRAILLLLVVIVGMVRMGFSDPPAPASPEASPKKPAVLFIDTPGGMSFDVCTKLSAAGFNVAAVASIDSTPLTWAQVQKYNVIVFCGLGMTNADRSFSANMKQNLDVLHQFAQAGGGLLVMPYSGQDSTGSVPQETFLKPMGLTLLFAELPIDPQTSITATAWRLPFAYTDAITPSPVTDGVKGLWYPAMAFRPGGQSHSFTFQTDSTWTTVVRGSSSSSTVSGNNNEAVFTHTATFSKDVPLVAIRPGDKSRAMIIGITSEYVYGRHAETTLENIFLQRGFKKTPSFGYQLLENGLRWLAEPSMKDLTLGGAAADPVLLENPIQVKFATPYDWSNPPYFPLADAVFPGVIGARTTYSSGKATPEAWIAAAKAQGLSYIVFLEEFSKLSAQNFDKLKADCSRLSTDDFTAIPGFTIDDEIGNHYFYFGSSFPYPPKNYLSEDGTVFHSYDPQFDAKNSFRKGQLAMTTLLYGCTDSSFKLTCGNYYFKDDPIPFVDFFSDWDAVGVVTQKDGVELEDATEAYKRVSHSGQGPLPLAIDLMSDPSQLAKTKWRTVLRLPSGHPPTPNAPTPPGTKIRDYFNEWHLFPEGVQLAVSNGPQIEYWAFAGPRDYVGNLKGDFVWQNYRWILKGKVTSDVGLAEVAVYDGPGNLFRRYLPGGQKSFEFQIDQTHDRQHTLILVATDKQGQRAVSSEHIDRNQRLEEFQCSDRNNQLSYAVTARKDGTFFSCTGNGSTATPWKRIYNELGPSGAFGNDPLLGWPAFDGGPSGASSIFEQGNVIGTSAKIPEPVVTDSDRLLVSKDIEMGEGKYESAFADNIQVGNLWRTLWRTVPVKEYSITRRNCYILPNPESPIAVFLLDLTYKLKQDLPNQGFHVAMMTPGLSNLWTWRDSQSVLTGQWEDTPVSEGRTMIRSFEPGSYFGFLDSPLGGSAIIPITPGLQASFGLPARNNFMLSVAPESSPQKTGEEKHIRLLLLGLPRQTPVTKMLPTASTEVVERFFHDFGLDGGKTGYSVTTTAGTVLDQRYVLSIDGKKDKCFSGTLEGKIVSSLPLTVDHMNNHWSAFLYDRTLQQARPLGVFENKTWATLFLNDKLDLFIGHPVTADSEAVFIQVTQTGETAWAIEVHNPTDKPIETTVRKNPHFDPFKDKTFSEKVTIPAGSSIYRQL
jgi:hypothetical protein